MSRLRDRWDTDLTADEIVTEKDDVIVFGLSDENPVMTVLKFNSEDFEGDERTYIDKDVDENLARIDFYWLRIKLLDLINRLY